MTPPPAAGADTDSELTWMAPQNLPWLEHSDVVPGTSPGSMTA